MLSRVKSIVREHAPKDRKHVKNFLKLQIVEGAIVYAAYSPYVLIWLHFNDGQYWKWLVGGIPMALAFNLFFTPIYAKLLKRWPIN